MRKVLGVTFALAVALTLPAAAMEKQGTVRSVDIGEQSFVLEDGTELSLSSDHLVHVSPGDKVLVTYETKEGRNVVVEFEVRTMGPEGQETTNLGSKTQIFELSDVQGEGSE